LKTAVPGGLVSKSEYDGAGRGAKSYVTDGGGDTAWTDADDVTGDVVLEQSENTYDADSNVIIVTMRQRFHDETATGALANPTTAPKARVSYATAYYDKADRLTASVNVGTNAGSSYTRPSSVPSRSDTVLVTSQTYNTAGWVSTSTDPRGIESRISYDNLGRTTKTIEAYADGTPDGASDKTNEFTYDGSNHVLTLKAYLTGTTYQKTQWVYGVTTGGGSGVNSNDLLAEMRYPDKTSGDPSTTEKDIFTYNALGQTKTKQDRNGNAHTYSFDVVGRLTTDAVTTLGSGVDGAVRRAEIAYDTGGRPYLFTNYDASSGGNIVNQVQRDFNGLGQLTKEYQAHGGAVNTGTSPKVQYAYSEMTGGANHSRPTNMTYPNGRVLDYVYGSGLDTTISRLTSLSSNSTTLESLSYLGLGTVVKRAHSQPGVDLTYIKQGAEGNGDAGDQYTGLDRFGRVVDQRWIKTSDGSHTDRFKYGYDRDSNRLYRENLVNAAFSELYHADGASGGYDNLNQLVEFQRGTLSDTNSDDIPDTVATSTRSQSWTMDGQGNWSSLNMDGTSVSRTHNKQNQVTVVGSANLSFDSNGNLTTDEVGQQYVYDAWNRLVTVKNSGGTTIASYKIDALGRRIQETVSGTTTDFYFSAAWQVVEEQVSGTTKVQYVWSPVYIDALVLRDRDADGNAGNGLEERFYVQQDANFNVTAIINTSGSVVERYVYDPYGTPTFLSSGWTGPADGYAWRYLHQGTKFESVHGNSDNRERVMRHTLGRPLQVDRLGFGAGDTNHYRFEGGNPANLLDPSGLDSIHVEGDTVYWYVSTPWLPWTGVYLAIGTYVAPNTNSIGPPGPAMVQLYDSAGGGWISMYDLQMAMQNSNGAYASRPPSGNGLMDNSERQQWDLMRGNIAGLIRDRRREPLIRAEMDRGTGDHLAPAADPRTNPTDRIEFNNLAMEASIRAEMTGRPYQLPELGFWAELLGPGGIIDSLLLAFSGIGAGTSNVTLRPAGRPLHRPYLRVDTVRQIRERQLMRDGQIRHPRTGQAIEGPMDIGHVPGRESWRLITEAMERGMTQAQFNDWINGHPEWFQFEPRAENRCHRHEQPPE
jgi:RHS repeat-associated protein